MNDTYVSPASAAVRFAVSMERIQYGSERARVLAEQLSLDAEVHGTPEDARRVRTAATVGLHGSPVGMRGSEFAGHQEAVGLDLVLHGDDGWASRNVATLDRMANLVGLADPSVARLPFASIVAERLGRDDLARKLMDEAESMTPAEVIKRVNREQKAKQKASR